MNNIVNKLVINFRKGILITLRSAWGGIIKNKLGNKHDCPLDGLRCVPTT
jgi:hypothetical protein